jgi:hypothetical protein
MLFNIKKHFFIVNGTHCLMFKIFKTILLS